MTVSAKMSVMVGGLKPTGLGEFVTRAAPAGVYSLNNNLGNPGYPWVYRIQNDIWGRLPSACQTDRYFETESPEASAEYELLGKTQFVSGRGNMRLVDLWKIAGATWNAPYNEWDLGDLVTIYERNGQNLTMSVVIPLTPDAVAKAQWMTRWNIRALDIAFGFGLHLSIGSWATGGPDLDLLPYLLPMFRKGQECGAIMDSHEYGVEGALQTSPSSGALHYREVYERLPEDARINIVVSEFWSGNGVQSGGNRPAQLDDAAWYGSELHKDPYLLWASAFQLNEGGENNMPKDMLLQYADRAALVAATAPPPLPPEPAPDEESIEGDFAAGLALIDQEQHTWTLGEIRSEPGYPVLKDDEPWAAGFGVSLLYHGHQVYVTNSFAQWYLATPTGYTQVAGDPRLVQPPIPPPPHKLAVPWVGQNTSLPTDDYSNSDCGPASLCAWLQFRGKSVTVDDVSKATGLPPGYTSTTFADLDRAANAYGLDLTQKVGSYNLALIRSEIEAGRPSIALVYYKSLPFRWDPNYALSHWILLVGFTEDGGFFYHDPYWPTAEQGAFLPITSAQLTRALEDVTLNGNTALQGSVENTTPVPPPLTKAWRGLHMRADGHSPASDMQALLTAKCNAAKLMTNTGFDELDALLANGIPAGQIVLRLFADGSNPSLRDPARFVNEQGAWIAQFFSKGGRYVEIHNEPNLAGEGLGSAWPNAAGFGTWYKDVANRIKAQWPGVLRGWPGLSPQPNVPEWIATLDNCITAGTVDWIGAHAYWTGRPNMDSEADGRYYRRYLNKGKPVLITEFCNVIDIDSDLLKGQQYRDYYASLESGVLGAYCFVSSASNTDFNKRRLTWVRNNALTQIPYEVGK